MGVKVGYMGFIFVGGYLGVKVCVFWFGDGVVYFW